MNNLLDLSRYKNREELENYTQQLFMQVAILQREINELKSSNESSKDIVNIILPNAPKSQEEALLMRELDHIDRLSKVGGLQLEETKQLKMIIDSLVSLRRLEKGLEDKPIKVPKMDPIKLLQMVKDNKLDS